MRAKGPPSTHPSSQVARSRRLTLAVKGTGKLIQARVLRGWAEKSRNHEAWDLQRKVGEDFDLP